MEHIAISFDNGASDEELPITNADVEMIRDILPARCGRQTALTDVEHPKLGLAGFPNSLGRKKDIEEDRAFAPLMTTLVRIASGPAQIVGLGFYRCFPMVHRKYSSAKMVAASARNIAVGREQHFKTLSRCQGGNAAFAALVSRKYRE
ncbi:hypothetical protein WNZ14_17785 [Hoeflea sp. AS60]|uniref:hypothetical protein n=1 Tax=Hoeflea sp. AS60 TaxID=3135780 RepID=UPI00316CF272